jgi:hypothetical protein
MNGKNMEMRRPPVTLFLERIIEIAITGIVEYDEARGLLLTERWQDRNRRASDYLQDAQRDRQTSSASLSSEHLVVFLFRIVFQERIVKVASTASAHLLTVATSKRIGFVKSSEDS